MTAENGVWNRRWNVPGTWAVMAAVFFAILVALYGLVPPVYPVLFLLPLVLCVIPLAVTISPWVIILRILAWIALTITGLVIGLSVIPCWVFMGISVIVSAANLFKWLTRAAACS